MISFGALAAFSFVNLAVIRTYIIGRGRRSPADAVKYGVVPFLGFVFTLYLWTQLSSLTFEVGLSWLAAGFVYLLALTRMFRRPPPELYTEEDVADDREPAAIAGAA